MVVAQKIRLTHPSQAEEDDLPSSRWSLRKIEVFVAEGAGGILQISGKCVVAAILGFFKNQPVKFDVSIGRILKEIEIQGPDPDVPNQANTPCRPIGWSSDAGSESHTTHP